MCCCAWQPNLLKKKFFCPKIGENGSKVGFFEFIGKFSHYFFLYLVYKDRLYYLLYSFTNPILRKNLVPEIWAKMPSANQIAGFLNWLYLLNKMIKKPDFLHIVTDSWKLKVSWKILGWVWSKMGVATLVYRH